MAIKNIPVQRLTIELPMRSFERLKWCRDEIGTGSMVEVIRHAIREYETHLKAQRKLRDEPQASL